jgi:hypothetical protein
MVDSRSSANSAEPCQDHMTVSHVVEAVGHVRRQQKHHLEACLQAVVSSRLQAAPRALDVL